MHLPNVSPKCFAYASCISPKRRLWKSGLPKSSFGMTGLPKSSFGRTGLPKSSFGRGDLVSCVSTPTVIRRLFAGENHAFTSHFCATRRGSR